MALCRWSNSCDVYAYSTSRGYTIHDGDEHSWYNCSTDEALDIFSMIRLDGQQVPDHVFFVLQSRLERERSGETEPFQSDMKARIPYDHF